MDFSQIMIAIAAIWGAVLSTYTAIRSFSKEKPKIKVKLSYGFLAYGPDLSPQMLLLEAANVGRWTVTLSSCGLTLPSRITPFMTFIKPQSNKEFPCELSPGKNLLVWMEKSELSENLRSHRFRDTIKIRGVYKDAVGNSYTSKSLKFSIE